MPHSTQPLASHQPVPHPLLAFPPFHTPQFPTVQVTLFTQTTSATPVVLVWTNKCPLANPPWH